jgi:hypothetical protein
MSTGNTTNGDGTTTETVSTGDVAVTPFVWTEADAAAVVADCRAGESCGRCALQQGGCPWGNETTLAERTVGGSA